MSGFLALLSLDGPVDEVWATGLHQSLQFRGPDGLGTRSLGTASLGHSLLRTRDADSCQETVGPHPISEDVWLVADARLDDRHTLARALGDPAAASLEDATLLAKAWRRWGPETVDHLVGDYAFAVWDGPRQRLWAARDPLGVKPCYWCRTPRWVAVSNTLQTLRRVPGVSERLDDLAVTDFLLFGANQELSATVFRDIRRLPPGHRLQVAAESPEPRVERAWTLPEPRGTEASGEGLVEAYRQTVEAAVADRLTSTQATIYLSGGMDSTTVAALARQELERRGSQPALEAHTLVYERLFDDPEGPVAQRAAKALGLPSTLHPLDACQLFAGRGRRFPSPEPADGSHLDLDTVLYEPVASRMRVALTGDGADPALFHPSDELWRQLERLRPDRALAYLVGHTLRLGRLPPLGVRTMLERWGLRRRPTHEPPSWLAPRLVASVDPRHRLQEVEARRCSGFEDQERPEAFRWLFDPQWTAYFEVADPGATGRRIETRYPFFDLRVLTLTLHAPTAWCLDKRLLRAAMADILPAEVLRRAKTPMAGNPSHDFIEPPVELFTRLSLESPHVLEYVDRASFVEAWEGWRQTASSRSSTPAPPDSEMLRVLELAYWLADMRSDKE